MAESRLLKVAILGASGCGKTQMVLRFVKNEFLEDKQSTTGSNFEVKSHLVDGAITRFQLWDTAGRERFRSLLSMYYRRADAIVMTYDITDDTSFETLQEMLANIKKEFAGDKLPSIILVGNKADLAHQRKVATATAQAFANANDLTFQGEVSAKTGEGVEALFNCVAKPSRKIHEIGAPLNLVHASEPQTSSWFRRHGGLLVGIGVTMLLLAIGITLAITVGPLLLVTFTGLALLKIIIGIAAAALVGTTVLSIGSGVAAHKIINKCTNPEALNTDVALAVSGSTVQSHKKMGVEGFAEAQEAAPVRERAVQGSAPSPVASPAADVQLSPSKQATVTL